MSGETDLLNLYSQRILALAAAIPLTQRLEHPQGTAFKRSPLCGSTVIADVKLADGKIVEFGQDVKACALGQASASILGAHIIGRSQFDLKSLRDQLRKMLRENGAAPAAPFDGYQVLEPARDYKNRHASIMLAVDAALEAMEIAQA